MNLQFFFNITYLHLRKRNVIRRLLFSFFNRKYKDQARINVRLLKLERLDRKAFRIFDRNAIVAFFLFYHLNLRVAIPIVCRGDIEKKEKRLSKKVY